MILVGRFRTIRKARALPTEPRSQWEVSVYKAYCARSIFALTGAILVIFNLFNYLISFLIIFLA